MRHLLGVARTGSASPGHLSSSSKKRPVRPSADTVASRIAAAAPCWGVRTPRKPLRSVAVKPGQTALIRMWVSASSLAYCTVTALRNVFDGA